MAVPAAVAVTFARAPLATVAAAAAALAAVVAVARIRRTPAAARTT